MLAHKEKPVYLPGLQTMNAVYHTTGKRIRELPVTPDKVLG
jgi:hypothetical protein